MNYIVIGSGYGDEGKGLMTDYLTRQSNADYVVRFNGGPQAGHTVVTESARHVFGHVGAGTFAGANTYLTKDFLINPRMLSKELETLKKIGYSPSIVADEMCNITTVFDVAINTAVEQSRGGNKHGSCGMGINETVVRSLDPAFQISLLQMRSNSISRIIEKLKKIHLEWVPRRLVEHGLDLKTLPNFIGDFLRSDIDYEAEAYTMLQGLVHIHMHIGLVDRVSDNIVLEGAQGLALDEDLGHFPYVTRSNTGATNALKFIRFSNTDYWNYRFEMKDLELVYVTRAYTTRHGAGPLEQENENIGKGAAPYDMTNAPNEFQDSMRIAPLNLQRMKWLIDADIARAWIVNEDQLRKQVVIAITCLDQLADHVNVVDVNGVTIEMNTADLPDFVERQLDLKVKYLSHGPMASNVSIRK
jgi:adenylosuccinate synthase